MVASTQPGQGDFISLPPEDFETEELREVIFGRSERLPKVFALNLLRRREYPQRVADLAYVLADEQEAPGIRHAAALELGRLASPEAIKALRETTASPDPLVRQGISTAISSLKGESPDQPTRVSDQEIVWPEARRVQPSRVLPPFPHESALLVLGDQEPSQILVRPATTQELMLAVRQATGQEPEEAPSLQGLALNCEGSEFMYIPPTGGTLPSAADLLRDKRSLGLVAIRHPQEYDQWEAKYAVFSQPSDRSGQLQIFIINWEGEVVYAGEGALAEAKITFRLAAVDKPGAVPIEVAGALEEGNVRIERAQSGAIAKEPLAPKPLSN